jgi:hypothetical protein
MTFPSALEGDEAAEISRSPAPAYPKDQTMAPSIQNQAAADTLTLSCTIGQDC